jgi:hypothetical protein
VAVFRGKFDYFEDLSVVSMNEVTQFCKEKRMTSHEMFNLAAIRCYVTKTIKDLADFDFLRISKLALSRGVICLVMADKVNEFLERRSTLREFSKGVFVKD